MKVLAVHNLYQQPGGEDGVFRDETTLLETYGHQVTRYTVHNDRIAEMRRPRLAKDALWNSSVYRELRDLVREERPQVAHFHNTFPLISAAGYYAMGAENVPVVQTLHNYRLMCPNGLFFRDGRPCEDCLGKTFPWPGVVHNCYRGDRAASGLAATVSFTNRLLDARSRQASVYIALTDFARDKLVEGGLPPDRVTVKPNFVSPDTGSGRGSGGYALFVGRLSPEKGVRTLLEAWKILGEGGMPLKILGDGPLADEVARTADENPRVEWLGYKPSHQVRDHMREAAALIFPSEWYETFGRVAVEAFASGTPVIVSDIGAISGLVEHRRTGLHFRPGEPRSLAEQVRWISAHPAERSLMRQEARSEYESKYTADRNYGLLLAIYERAIDSP